MATLLRLLKHRLTIVLLILLALAGAWQFGAPPLLRMLAMDWLHDHGAARAEIGSIGINPFAGTLVVHDLNTGDGLSIGKAAVNIDWWPLWHHQLFVYSVTLEHAALKLVQDNKARWQIAGLDLAAPGETATAAAGHSPWYVVLDKVNLRDVRIKLAGHGIQADIPLRHLELHLASMSRSGSQVLNTKIQLGQASASGHGYRLADTAFLLRGQLILPGPAETNAPLAARNIAIKVTGLTANAKDGQLTLSIGHTLLSGASMQGTASLKADDLEIESLQLDANAAKAADLSQRISLVSVRKLSLNTLSVNDMKHGAFARLTLRGIALPATKDLSMGSIGSIAATDADIASPDSMHLGRLDVQGLKLALQHEKDGLAVLNRLKTLLPPSPATKIPTATATTPPPAAAPKEPNIGIGLVTIDKGSKIAFADDAVYPPFQSSLEVESFRLAPLEIGAKQPSSLNAVFKVGDQGQLTTQGDLTLDRADPAAKLSIALKRLSMPMLSGYLAKSFGYTIRTGQMDLDGRLHIHNHAIDAKNKLAIRNLALDATKQSDKAAQRIGMPLDMAVSMLQDDRGDISLNVPVTGRLDIPNVNINDAINQAVSRALATAIKTGAMSYASLLLQPYGSILPALSLASGLLKDVSKPRLTPISFAPRAAALSKQAKAYIGKIAMLLKQKPLRLQACGVASRAEVEAESHGKQSGDETQNKRLLSLADARSTAVIKTLVAEGISPDRIFECEPLIDIKANAAGRVELLLN